MGVLKDVPWRLLADQLNLRQEANIHEVCKNDQEPVTCAMRKVVKEFTDIQPPQSWSCRDIVKKIATALEKLTPPRIRQASELRNMYNIGEKMLFFLGVAYIVFTTDFTLLAIRILHA